MTRPPDTKPWCCDAEPAWVGALRDCDQTAGRPRKRELASGHLRGFFLRDFESRHGTSAKDAVYGNMTTPNANSPADTDVDLHANAMASDDSGLSASDMIARNVNYSGHPQTSEILRCNVGRTEQNFRLAAGGALLAAAALAPLSSPWRVLFAALGAGELITGVSRYCPVSEALGINTCRAGEW